MEAVYIVKCIDYSDAYPTTHIDSVWDNSTAAHDRCNELMLFAGSDISTHDHKYEVVPVQVQTTHKPVDIYHFVDNSWWSDPGCDCCEGTLEEAYNCENKIVPGTAHSEEECYLLALKAEGHTITHDMEHDWSVDDLIGLCDQLELYVIIDTDEDKYLM